MFTVQEVMYVRVFGDVLIKSYHATSLVHRRQTTVQASTAEELVYHEMAAQLSSAFAAKLGWAGQGLTWFAFGQVGDNSSQILVTILLADKRIYGLSVSVRGTLRLIWEHRHK
jgi:hypothetical protein